MLAGPARASRAGFEARTARAANQLMEANPGGNGARAITSLRVVQSNLHFRDVLVAACWEAC